MKATVSPSFWSDSELEKHGPEIKLAALWLITNGATSIIGVCSASPKRFHFETGLSQEWFDRALEALPKSFIRFGDVIFIRNFIRHQFGSGESLKKNNCFRPMVAIFSSIKDQKLLGSFLAEYPEFEGLGKGLGRAIQAPEKRIEEKSGEESGIGVERKGIPTLEEVEAYVTTSDTMGITQDCAEAWFDDRAKLDWHIRKGSNLFPLTGDWRHDLRGFARSWKAIEHDRSAKNGTIKKQFNA